MKIAINKHLEPYLDVDTLRVAGLSLTGFAAIMFVMAALLLPPAKTIPLEDVISIRKSVPVSSLAQADMKPMNNAEDSIAGMHESSPYGLLPIKTANGTSIFESYRQKFIPATANAKTFSLVFYDVGLSETLTITALESLPRMTTLVISPYAHNAQNLISQARAKGFEVWLFLPLESANQAQNDGGEKTLSSDAGLKINEKNLLQILGIGTGYTGIITNKDNVFIKNETAFKPINDILQTRGVKLIEADVSGFEFKAPDNAAGITFVPLSHGGLKASAEWLASLPKSAELAPLSHQLQ
jgi:polysaccharide deacetylase 2 family uncharacterized protein YibQ